MRLVVICFFWLAACGDAERTQRASIAVAPTATPRGADDVVVAQVNGRPVYGSCVTAQSRGQGKTKQAALDECIAFELLAQEAEQRGLAQDPEIVEATRAALVNRMIETGFEDKFKTPADLAEPMNVHIERNKPLLDRPEGRASAYARVELPRDGAPPDEDWKARQLAEKLVERLEDEVGLTPQHLKDAADEIFAGSKYLWSEVPAYGRGYLVPAYDDALFAIPEVGRIWPAAIRTKWGWDVIMLAGIVPPTSYTREQAAAEAFEEVRRSHFQTWVNQIIKSRGTRIEIDPKTVAKLDEEKS